MERPRLTLIGTGHVFRIGPAVREAIVALGPQAVFVELDRGRFQALQARREGKGQEERGSFIQRRLQAFQEGVAGMYGAQVGEEMLAAVDGARSLGVPVRFIDPPAEDTVKRALKALTWRERGRAVGLLAKSLVTNAVPRKGTKERLEQEIARYQGDPEAALEELRRQFPSLYRVVIAERDAKMARAIQKGMQGVRHGVAVVGDGHVPGLLRHLDPAGEGSDGEGPGTAPAEAPGHPQHAAHAQGAQAAQTGGPAPQVQPLDVHTYRLRDVREGRLPTPGNNVYRFGFWLGRPPQTQAATAPAPPKPEPATDP